MKQPRPASALEKLGGLYTRRDLLLTFHICLLVAFSLLFSQTRGLAYASSGAPEYTSKLQSSGADDNASISAGVVIFGVALLFSAIPAPRPLLWLLKSFAIWGCWFLQLVLIPPEVGDISFTIFRVGNAALAFWLVAFGLLPVTLILGGLSRSDAHRVVA